MPAPFSTSLRTLAAERGRGLELAVALAVALLSAWTWWMCSAEVVLVELSARANLESVTAAVPVTTLVGGRVEQARLGLGRRVEAGEVLVTLETAQLRLEREGQVVELAALRAQLAASEREHAAIAAAIDIYRRGGQARTSEAQASAREAEALAVLAASRAARDRELAREGVASLEAEEQSAGQQQARTAGAASRRLQAARTAAEVRERLAAFTIELARLDRQRTQLRGELERREAALVAFDRRIAEHQIRAPIAGTLGHAPPLHPGAVLAEHATVAQIIPDGALRIVAGFRPAALGRLRPGQPVRMRLSGFPWTEYGALRGTILRVASEAAGGSLRVECSLDPTSAPAIPREHGLVGTLEVEIDRRTPASLLTRASAS